MLNQKEYQHMTKDTRQPWEIARDERDAARNEAANNLLPMQVAHLKKVIKTIRTCDFELHESYDLSVYSMKLIDGAEWQLRAAFPQLYQEISDEMECNCED